MPKEIAVHVGENGETTSLNEKGTIIVYQKKQGKWTVSREKDFFPEQGLGLKELREKLDEVISFLAECKVFVGLSIVGVPYFSLEKAGFSVWEFKGKPLEFLDYILEKEEEEQAEQESQKPNNVVHFPVETSAGCYKLSLKEIQENNLGVTSKQVLLPFLRKGKFYSLEVICSHLPPWLEAELMSGN
ncbi:MAG: nitrogenase, partial [Clostridia bacterium]|nr:nitrogenase [Clostridia bacterium]